MNGSLQLSEYPGDMVRLSCEKCGRSGQYRKQKLIERYGADIRLPDLREEIAQCERMGKMHDACMVHYVELVSTR
jgi:IS1 family transposase